MRGSRADGFIDQILADRPPDSFRADPADADILRVAIALRAGRWGLGGPDEQFVEQLHCRLAAMVRQHDAPLSLISIGSHESDRTGTSASADLPSRSVRIGRRRFALMAKAAAVLALVAGTIATTRAVEGRSQAPVVQKAATVAAVRSGVLLTADGLPLAGVSGLSESADLS